MSWFSKTILDPIERALGSQPPTSQGAQALTAFTQAGEALVPTLATTAANAALAAVPGGVMFEGLADELIPAIIAILFKQASPVAQGTVQAALAPVVSAAVAQGSATAASALLGALNVPVKPPPV